MDPDPDDDLPLVPAPQAPRAQDPDGDVVPPSVIPDDDDDVPLVRAPQPPQTLSEALRQIPKQAAPVADDPIRNLLRQFDKSFLRQDENGGYDTVYFGTVSPDDDDQDAQRIVTTPMIEAKALAPVVDRLNQLQPGLVELSNPGGECTVSWQKPPSVAYSAASVIDEEIETKYVAKAMDMQQVFCAAKLEPLRLREVLLFYDDQKNETRLYLSPFVRFAQTPSAKMDSGPSVSISRFWDRYKDLVDEKTQGLYDKLLRHTRNMKPDWIFVQSAINNEWIPQDHVGEEVVIADWRAPARGQAITDTAGGTLRYRNHEPQKKPQGRKRPRA